jgi:hypothetical protein
MNVPEWRVMAGAAETGGAFELIQETRAVEGGPAPHVHHEHGEGFLVLEGRYRFVQCSSCQRATTRTRSRSPRRRSISGAGSAA